MSVIDIVREKLGGVISFTVRQVKSVKSCDRCDGTGQISREELVSYHNNEYDTIYTLCKVCNAEGRVVIITDEVRVNTRMNSAILDTKTRIIPYSQDPITKPISTEQRVQVELKEHVREVI